MTRRIPLPEPVARMYKATAEFEALYPGRKFTPDGHLLGSIGEVTAAEALGLTLYPMSKPGHDAFDANGDVQIKLTAGKGSQCTHVAFAWLFFGLYRRKRLRLFMTAPVTPHGTGPGRCRKNGQRAISIEKLRALATATG